MGPSGTDETSDGMELPDDVVADILGAERRRYALEVLSQQRTPMVVDDLAAVVRARETDSSPDAIEQAERQQVRDDFFQRHLPKLTATDVVRYDSVLGTVELARPEPFGEIIEEH